MSVVSRSPITAPTSPSTAARDARFSDRVPRVPLPPKPSMQLIHDVSTDIDNPPPFVALRTVRLACKNGVDYSGIRDNDEHKRRYPAVVPSRFDTKPAIAYEKALAAARAMDWKIIATDAREGRIEATATTRLMRFKDDVVIRVVSDGTGSRVDVRSASRVGRSDLGANAARILQFLDKLIIDLGARSARRPP